MSAAIRDPLADHLITPQNSALILIDYQPAQVEAVRSMDQDATPGRRTSSLTVKLAEAVLVRSEQRDRRSPARSGKFRSAVRGRGPRSRPSA